MLHEALMLEIYRQALNAGALPTARPRSTESANSSERCPSHESNASENGRDQKEVPNLPGMFPLPASPNPTTFPVVGQNLPSQASSMEAYLQMVAAAAQQYGFPLGAAASNRLPLSLPTSETHFKLPPQDSPTTSSNNSEALDFRTNTCGTVVPEEPQGFEEDEDDEENPDNPLDLSVGPRKRAASTDKNLENSLEDMQVKKMFKSGSPSLSGGQHNIPNIPAPQVLPGVNPYLAAVAAANIFGAGQFAGWSGKNDLVVDPLEKMSDIVKSQRKEKSTARSTSSSAATISQTALPSQNPTPSTSTLTNLSPSNEGITKTRHNIWQSHWQNKGVASSVFRCVWCKQSFPTLEALTIHMKDSKHCGVNVPPFGNLPNLDRNHQPPSSSQPNPPYSHNLRKHSTNTSSAAAKAAFQYRGDPPTPLPRKLVRGQNVWLGKGVEQAMQILKCMRCGESFRSLGDMTKHMQETQHYTNILSQEQTLSVKSSSADSKECQNSLSSEESRTLSAVLTCKVCDKAFNSLGELSNHMAKNNHYAEPLMQSMCTSGNRKRAAPKKREKSLPVRKLLELKGSQNEADAMEAKQQRSFESNKRISLDGAGVGPSSEKGDAALFAERMRQYISSVKSSEETKSLSPSSVQGKNKSPDIEQKNGIAKVGTSSVLSAIEQMFTTSFDTPSRHASLPATSPSNSSTKNTSPVASSILKRLGIDENIDYNKPLIDTSDPYFQHFRYTSSERSASECSAEAHGDFHKAERFSPDKMQAKISLKSENEMLGKKDSGNDKPDSLVKSEDEKKVFEIGNNLKKQNSTKVPNKEDHDFKACSEVSEDPTSTNMNGSKYSIANNNNKEEKFNSSRISSPVQRSFLPRSPTESHRSATPKSPASSIKSYDGEKKYPSDSLNALSSMFDSLGSSESVLNNSRAQPLPNNVESPENLSSTNSLAALRQFCVKKEKTT